MDGVLDARKVLMVDLKACRAVEEVAYVFGNSSTRRIFFRDPEADDFAGIEVPLLVIMSRLPKAPPRCTKSWNCVDAGEEPSTANAEPLGFFHSRTSKSIDRDKSVTVVVLPVPEAPLRMRTLYVTVSFHIHFV